MAIGDMRKEDFCVIVSSTDSYHDLWDPYFFFFFKFWLNCPFRVYLVTESKTFNDSRVSVITTGNGLPWSQNLRHALLSVPEKYVILSLEDFFLRQKVSNEDVFTACHEMIHLNISMLRIHPNPRGSGRKLSDNVKEITGNDPYSISTQASIWRKSFLLELLAEPQNIWQFELINSKQFYPGHRLATVEKSIFNYRHHMVQGGELFPWFYFICIKHGYYKKLNRQIISPSKVLEWFLRISYLKLANYFKVYK